jgi:hypothetical protein
MACGKSLELWPDQPDQKMDVAKSHRNSETVASIQKVGANIGVQSDGMDVLMPVARICTNRFYLGVGVGNVRDKPHQKNRHMTEFGLTKVRVVMWIRTTTVTSLVCTTASPSA